MRDIDEQGAGTPSITIPEATLQKLEQLPEAASPDWYTPHGYNDSHLFH